MAVEVENLLVIMRLVFTFAKDKMKSNNKTCTFLEKKQQKCLENTKDCNCHKNSTLCQCHFYQVTAEFLKVKRTSLDEKTFTKFSRSFQNVIVLSVPIDERHDLSRETDNFLSERVKNKSGITFNHWCDVFEDPKKDFDSYCDIPNDEQNQTYVEMDTHDTFDVSNTDNISVSDFQEDMEVGEPVSCGAAAWEGDVAMDSHVRPDTTLDRTEIYDTSTYGMAPTHHDLTVRVNKSFFSEGIKPEPRTSHTKRKGIPFIFTDGTRGLQDSEKSPAIKRSARGSPLLSVPDSGFLSSSQNTSMSSLEDSKSGSDPFPIEVGVTKQNEYSSDQSNEIGRAFEGLQELTEKDANTTLTKSHETEIEPSQMPFEENTTKVTAAVMLSGVFEERLRHCPKNESKYPTPAMAEAQKKQSDIFKEKESKGKQLADDDPGADVVEIEDKHLDIQKGQQQKEKNNLELADILLTKVELDLDKMDGVCGYTLNGKYMKMKVVLLKSDSREEVLTLLEEEIKKIDQLKGKNVSDLVHIEVIDELPVIYRNCCPGVSVKMGEYGPWLFTTGLIFCCEDRFLLSTCSHGIEFDGAEFTTKLDQESLGLLENQDEFNDSFRLGTYRGHVYNIIHKRTVHQEPMGASNDDEGHTMAVGGTKIEPDPPGIKSVDFSMIELISGLEAIYYPQDMSGHVAVTGILPDDINLVNTEVQKQGAETHLTYGVITEIIRKHRFTLKEKNGSNWENIEVEIRGVVKTKPVNANPEASNSTQHSQTTPDMKDLRDGYTPQGVEPFATRGDSGAIITTRVQNSEVKAISKHLYTGYFGDGSASLSCTIQTAKELFEKKYETLLAFRPHRLPNYAQSCNQPTEQNCVQVTHSVTNAQNASTNPMGGQAIT